MATIGAHYFKVCTLGAERAGLSRSDLLRSAGIAADGPESPDWRGSTESMSLLVRAIWTALDDEQMGFTARRMPVGALGMMTELAIGAPSILAALEKGIAFFALIDNGIETRIATVGEDVRISAAMREPALDPDHYFVEFWLIIWHRFACWLAGATIALRSADFDYPRPDGYLGEFNHLFPTRQRFDTASCCIHLDRTSLLGAVARSEAERREMIARAPLDFMTIPASDLSATRRVRRLLIPAAGAAFDPQPLGVIAATLGFSGAGLARALRREGTSLTRLCETVRCELASVRLTRSTETVEQIADALGFAETRSFTRAFRQWTGSSPLVFRRQARSQRPLN